MIDPELHTTDPAIIEAVLFATHQYSRALERSSAALQSALAAKAHAEAEAEQWRTRALQMEARVRDLQSVN